MRVIDVLEWHPCGAPLRCVEHDGDAPLPNGAVRMTVEEYRAREPAWQEAHAAWRRDHPEQEPPPALEPLPRLAFIALVEDGLGLDYDTLPALIDQHVADAAVAKRVKRALRHAVAFDPDAEPVDGVGAVRWIARQLGVTDERFAALWRAAGG